MAGVRQKLFRVSRKQLWLTFLFPGLFVADMLYGGLEYYGFQMPVSPGVVLRGIALLLSIIMILKYHFLVPKYARLWALATIMLTLPSIIGGAYAGGDLLRDIYYIMRAVYAPLLVLLITILIQKYHIEVEDIFQFIEYAAYVLGLALLISQLFGFQRATYHGGYALGNKGIFYSQNDLTLAFGISLLAASYRLVFSFSLIRLILLGLSTFACLQIGTRASLAVALGCALMIVILVAWGQQSKKHSYRIVVMRWLVGSIVVLGMIFMFVQGLRLQEQTSFQQMKLEQISKGELPRLLLINAGKRYLKKRPMFLNFTGEGMTSFMRGVAHNFPGPKDMKTVEVDWMDFYGAYGILFTVLIYTLFLFVLFSSTQRFLLSSRDPLYGLIAAATGMYLAHSVLAGHALTGPMPTALIAGYIGGYLTLNKPNTTKELLW